ncbi:MAG: hypothetical protein ACXADS_15110 [Candidatus Thorarchaeota archaeon]|jgi:hypothetical protein
MANFDTTADLKDYCLKKAGEPTDGSSDYDTEVLEFLNLMYFNVLAGGSEYNAEIGVPWVWAKSRNPGVLTFKPPYETGTVTLTNGSASGTFSTAPTGLGSFANSYQLKVADEAEFYIFQSHTADDTAFTLDGPYVGESGTKTFRAFKTDYDLTADVIRLISPFRVYRRGYKQPAEVALIERNAFDRDFPKPNGFIQGVPTHATLIYETNGTYTVRFNRWMDEEIRIEYDYIPIPAALTADPDITPILPREDRICLAYGAIHMILEDKNDDKADRYYQLTQAKLGSMVLANQKQMRHTALAEGAMIMPRQDQLRRFRRIFAAGDYFTD